MEVSEETLLKCGYKKFDISPFDDTHRYADKFYQKTFKGELTRHINVYYYDKFKDNGAIDYEYEFELVEEHNKYWTKKLMYGIDKDMLLEQVESKLIGE